MGLGPAVWGHNGPEARAPSPKARQRAPNETCVFAESYYGLGLRVSALEYYLSLILPLLRKFALLLFSGRRIPQ